MADQRTVVCDASLARITKTATEVKAAFVVSERRFCNTQFLNNNLQAIIQILSNI